MATLQIAPGWQITADTYSWMLQRIRFDKSKGGDVGYETTYHTTITHALQKYVGTKMRACDSTTVLGMLENLQTILDELKCNLGAAIQYDESELRRLIGQATDEGV